MCENTTQHFCILCSKKVCNIFCSEPDPDTSNEMRRRHKANDPRCKAAMLECPSCEARFSVQSELENHISRKHESSNKSLSLISEADDSSWTYMVCDICDGKYQNELDLFHHKERVHEYGETCQMYPCEECGFRARDLSALKNHTKEEHEVPLYQKRRKQNLQNINFDDDSDDEWNPNKEDEKLLAEEEDEFPAGKRKRDERKDTIDENLLEEEADQILPKRSRRTEKISEPVKASNLEHICEKCKKTFSRKDSLKRHVQNFCKI